MKIMLLGSKSAHDALVAKGAECEVSGHSVVTAFDNTLFTAIPDVGIPPPRLSEDSGHKEQRAAGFYRARAVAEARKKDATDKQKIYGLISSADAVLVINQEKNGVPGYVGATVLMELAVAHCLGKPILLLNALPTGDEHRWVHELETLHPTVLNGALTNMPTMGNLHWAGLG